MWDMFIRLTVNNRRRFEVSGEQTDVQSGAGQDEFKRGHLMKNILQLSEQEIGQTVTLVYFILRSRNNSSSDYDLGKDLTSTWCGKTLTTMTWVTVDRASSPDISVLSNTPLVQNVRRVLGETLQKHTSIIISSLKKNGVFFPGNQTHERSENDYTKLKSHHFNAVPALQTDLIADGLPDLLSALSRHALRYSDGRQSPGLSAKDPTGNPIPAAVVQEKLRDLTHKQTFHCFIHPNKDPLL